MYDPEPDAHAQVAHTTGVPHVVGVEYTCFGPERCRLDAGLLIRGLSECVNGTSKLWPTQKAEASRGRHDANLETSGKSLVKAWLSSTGASVGYI